MSQENVEVVRAVYDALATGDIDEAVRDLHPDVVLRPGIAPVEQGEQITGRTGVRRFFETLLVWQSRRVEFGEMISVGDRLPIVESWHFRGTQDIPPDFEVIDIYSFHDGLITRAEGFVDRREALEAVGLSE